ncbi:hypothetical protein DSL72_000275 [Monilinia vaccinii-corymbosi]|uniref:Potassium channel tetramerisation-type BTB domain-containing protein n=1 Tax=Monilinia vaccinii-corymbosi TaxID=61207 RepID=A0A8A3PA97_9HELO|nr:hypothetical protein DSL72_000275 [Monilinia vaccinii-corymbosi]
MSRSNGSLTPGSLGASGPSAIPDPDPPGILRKPQARKWNTDIPNYLPHEKVFPIQIGTECFRLSGASLSSDAPSYFSHYFQCQLKQVEENGDDPNAAVRTLYIDRDPITFKDISLHLQGYHVKPRDASHFVKLFADAQFFSLPRLISQLYEESIFITVGSEEFQIPREIFSDPGNSPNYFSLGFAILFSTPTEAFPGLNRDGLLRPPSILPPSVPSRSAKTFSEILHLLRGYPLEIRSSEHRAELLRDCRYFHLKGLEQKLIPHSISYNPFRKKSEITIRLSDIRQSGLSIVKDNSSATTAPSSDFLTSLISNLYPSPTPSISSVHYLRPFTDSAPHELILEVGDSATLLHWNTMRLEFFGEAKTRMGKFLEVMATKLNLSVEQPLGLLMRNGDASGEPASPGRSGVGGEMVRVVIGEKCGVFVDGRERVIRGGGAEDEDEDSGGHGSSSRKRRKLGDGVGVSASSNTSLGGSGAPKDESWIIKTGQWRLRIREYGGGGGVPGTGMGGFANGMVEWECVLVGVKLDAVSGERARNFGSRFLED